MQEILGNLEEKGEKCELDLNNIEKNYSEFIENEIFSDYNTVLFQNEIPIKPQSVYFLENYSK